MGEPRIGLGPLGKRGLGRHKFDLPLRPLFGRYWPLADIQFDAIDVGIRGKGDMAHCSANVG